jgi:RNA polymerase sigma-70 factor (ECF subfamily)
VDENEELDRLLTSAQKGNEEALPVLLDRLRPWVRQCAQGLLGRRLGARVDGSDIAQEVHARVWRDFDQFQGQTVAQLRAWIETTLRNIITDCRRHHGAGKRDADAEVAGADLFPGLSAGATTPSQGAMRNEQQARLAQALERLPEKQRLVFRLRLCDGLPFEEVARRVGVTVINARVLMLRATENLRKELGEEDA